MYQSVQEWMRDPEFVLHISVCQQLGEPALAQAVRRFNEEAPGFVAAWKSEGELSTEEKLAIVRKLKLSAAYIGARRIQQLAISLEPPLDSGVDQSIDPMMSAVEETLEKLASI